MEEKIREQIKEIENKIRYRQKMFNKAVEDFKKYVAEADGYQIATFVAGKAKEIADSRRDIEKLVEQKNVLEYVLSL